jgi:hypothetical protein
MSAAAPSRKSIPSLLAAVLVAAVWLGLPVAAGAQTPAQINRIKDLNRQALADYKAEDHESARIGLREAIALANRAGLLNDPLMARLWLNLAAVLINGVGDAEKGAKAVAVAVRIDPGIQLPNSLSTPALKEALDKARAGGGKPPAPPAEGAAPAVAPPGAPAAPPTPPPAAAAAAATPPAAPEAEAEPKAEAAPPPPKRRKRRANSDEPDLPATIPRPLYCPTADEVPPGEEIVLHCVLQAEVTAKKVTLHYRPPGEERFVASSTSLSPGGWYKAVIPGDAAVAGKSLHYYLEARDGAGEVVGNAGRDDSPNLVLVRDGAPPLGKGLYAGMRGPRREDGEEEEDGEEKEDDDPLKAVARQKAREREAAGIHRRRPGALFLGLSLGSGYGWHPRESLEFYDKSTIEAGWIPSGLFHLLPEVGWQFADRAALSVQARVQVISQQGSGDAKPGAPASGAFALLGRLQYFVGGGNMQGSLSLYAGGGSGFRLTIGPQPGTENLRNDSVRGGPLVAGAGFGIIYHFSERFGFVFDAKGLQGWGDQAFVLDGVGGAQVSF